jgi:predicted nucleic acid-binding protein
MLIDTSGFFCLHDVAERHHDLANKINQETESKVTTNYILAEYVALAIIRGLSRQKVLDFSKEILADESVEIIWVGESLHLRAVDLLADRTDKTYSLCDAVSFLIMRDREIDSALTTDRHFEQEGFVRLLK